MKKSSIYKSFSWNLIGSLIYAFTQYLLIITISRFGSAELLGIYSLGLALTAPIIMLTNLKLRSVQSTSYSNEFGFNDFASTRTFGNLVFLILTILISLIMGYEQSVLFIIITIAILKLVESFSELFYGALQFNERLDIVGKSYILRGFSSAIIFAVFLSSTQSLVISILAVTLSWVLILLFFDMRKSKPYIKLKGSPVNFTSVITIIKIAIPLGIISLLASLNVNIPRIIIEHNLTLKDLGYFTSVFYLTIILGKFVISVGAVILPRLSRNFEDKNYNYHLSLTCKFIILIIFMSSILIIGSYFFGEKLLILLYGEEFSHLGPLLILVMIYGLFNYLLYSIKISLESTKTYKPQMYVEILNVLITLTLSYISIPILGINGAVYSLIASSIISIVILTFLYIKIYRTLKRGAKNK